MVTRITHAWTTARRSMASVRAERSDTVERDQSPTYPD